jgi:hypothetical protein
MTSWRVDGPRHVDRRRAPAGIHRAPGPGSLERPVAAPLQRREGRSAAGTVHEAARCTMKKNSKLPVKLTLATETSRSLQDPDLKQVAGGGITDHFCGNSRATICTE